MMKQQMYEILRKNIDHDSSCGVVNIWGEYDHCTCGLRDALQNAVLQIIKVLDKEKIK